MSRCLSLLVLLLALSSHLIHAESYKVTGSIPIGGTGHWDYLVADSENRRLYNKTMVVVDADSGKVIANLPIGVHQEGAIYDPVTKLAFSSNIDASLTVVRQDGKDKYSVRTRRRRARCPHHGDGSENTHHLSFNGQIWT